MGGESEEVKAYSVRTYTMLSPRVLRVAANLQALVVSIRLHTTASVIENGKKLLLASDEDASCQMTFHSSWLRHNCCCSLCLTSSGQKTISHDCLSGDLKVSSANVEGDVKDNRFLLQPMSAIDYLVHSIQFCRRQSGIELE